MIYYIYLLFTQLKMSLGSLLIVYNLYFFIVFIIIIIIFSHLYINSSLYVFVLLSLNRPMFVCNPSETKVFSLMNSHRSILAYFQRIIKTWPVSEPITDQPHSQ